MFIIREISKLLEKAANIFPFIMYLHKVYYKKVVKKEIDLANITYSDRVLFIGGGSLPCTALEIAEQTGAKVWVIDSDPKAVKSACLVIKKLKLENKVKVLLSKGEEIDVEGFSVIHIASQAFPREKIMENVWKKVNREVRILVRIPISGLSHFYSSVEAKCQCGRCKGQEKYSDTKLTLLFSKESGGRDVEKSTPLCGRGICSSSSSLVG